MLEIWSYGSLGHGGERGMERQTRMRLYVLPNGNARSQTTLWVVGSSSTVKRVQATDLAQHESTK